MVNQKGTHAMSTSLSMTHLPPLGGIARDEAASLLQQSLVELIDLSLLGKQLHWSVVGPQFRPLHLYLDELIDSWRELADTVAERAAALGYSPDGQADTVAAGSQVARVERGAIEDRHVLRELAQRLAEVDERARGRMDRLGELDAAS